MSRRRFVALVSGLSLVVLGLLVGLVVVLITQTGYGRDRVRDLLVTRVRSAVHGKMYVGPIVTGDVFYGDPNPVYRWGRRGYLSVEMETATLYLLATGFSVLLGFIIFLAFQAYDDARAGAEVGGGQELARGELPVARLVELHAGCAPTV